MECGLIACGGKGHLEGSLLNLLRLLFEMEERGMKGLHCEGSVGAWLIGQGSGKGCYDYQVDS